MRNVPAWVPEVEAAIASGQDGHIRGREGYKKAAELILAALSNNTNLTQKQVAEHLGRGASWVCALLKWHRAGCPAATVFGPEIAARRAKSKAAIPTSELSSPDNGPDSPWLPGIEGGPMERTYDDSEVTRRALAATTASTLLLKELKSLREADLIRVYGWDTPKRQQTTLKTLTSQLNQSIAVGQAIIAGAHHALRRLDAPA